MHEQPTIDYGEFILRKSQLGGDHGFDPLWMPSCLFPFQASLTEWALRKGRGALFADCGTGKSLMELVFAENCVRKTNKPALILTPLAVAQQTVREGEKFGVDCKRVVDGAIGGSRVYVTNYDRLHHLNADDFSAVICDESSILKNCDGETRKIVTRFMSKIQYRLLGTATAAPNDYTELGTSSEALGGIGYSDMLSRFFRQTDNKKAAVDEGQAGGDYYAKLSFRVAQHIGQWRMRGHAITPFWRWVASWARACRKPSDLGFDDGAFVLPPLVEREHTVSPDKPAEGMLFNLPALGLHEEREERRRTLKQRCELAAQLADHARPVAVWCHMNPEGDLLEKLIKGSVQVSGKDSDDAKEEAYAAFASGEARVLITKPKIGAWGLNWQHCSDVVTFASHSYEQYYQSVRRCWRFGQTRQVTADIISTQGEVRVRDSMARKAKAADEMFTELVRHMNDATRIDRENTDTSKIEVPSWA